MGTGFRSRWVMSSCFLLLGALTLGAQTPPSESTSKVKRILLYNHTAGFYCPSCQEKTVEVFLHMGRTKGFEVETTSAVSFLTPDTLKSYQAIVWNNNHFGASSVPDLQARNAVSDFVRQGGGWMLINLANEHTRNWRFLDSLMGPGTSGWRGENVPATLVADSAAREHPELRFVVAALDTLRLRTNWLSVIPFDDSLHIKPVYRLKNAAWVTAAPARFSDRYVWAGTHQRGRALALPLGWQGGFGTSDIMTQADSAVPRLYWQGLRWLAGDYQGGCINPVMADFDPKARVDDGSCPASGIRAGRRMARNPVSVTGRGVLLATPVPGGSRIRLVDLQGHIVWKTAAQEPATAFDLPAGLARGLYFFEVTGTQADFQARILIP